MIIEEMEPPAQTPVAHAAMRRAGHADAIADLHAAHLGADGLDDADAAVALDDGHVVEPPSAGRRCEGARPRPGRRLEAEHRRHVRCRVVASVRTTTCRPPIGRSVASCSVVRPGPSPREIQALKRLRVFAVGACPDAPVCRANGAADGRGQRAGQNASPGNVAFFGHLFPQFFLRDIVASAKRRTGFAVFHLPPESSYSVGHSGGLHRSGLVRSDAEERERNRRKSFFDSLPSYLAGFAAVATATVAVLTYLHNRDVAPKDRQETTSGTEPESIVGTSARCPRSKSRRRGNVRRKLSATAAPGPAATARLESRRL